MPIRGFMKIGDPKINPQIVGFSYHKDPNKVPLMFGNPHTGLKP